MKKNYFITWSRLTLVWCLLCLPFVVEAVPLSSLDECLAHPQPCIEKTEQKLETANKYSREWYRLTYLKLSARWLVDSLSMSESELAHYVTLTSAPDVFKVTVYTIYAKIMLNKDNLEEGRKYAMKATELIKKTSEFAPDPRRFAELVILHTYLKNYQKASELDDVVNIQTPAGVVEFEIIEVEYI